ncbi:AraC family transcriptional regulator [Desulfosarcina sp. OttesenSCG-928-G10]|nr:AraC family transcriptional regulator [Desulfosarcina sp. OttesenSCG-928-G10]
MTDENRVDMDKVRALLKNRVNGRMPEPGEYQTGLAGVRLYRRDQVSKPGNCLYRPVIIKMAQGYKRAWIGAEEYRYGENEVVPSVFQ